MLNEQQTQLTEKTPISSTVDNQVEDSLIDKAKKDIKREGEDLGREVVKVVSGIADIQGPLRDTHEHIKNQTIAVSQINAQSMKQRRIIETVSEIANDLKDKLDGLLEDNQALKTSIVGFETVIETIKTKLTEHSNTRNESMQNYWASVLEALSTLKGSVEDLAETKDVEALIDAITNQKQKIDDVIAKTTDLLEKQIKQDDEIANLLEQLKAERQARQEQTDLIETLARQEAEDRLKRQVLISEAKMMLEATVDLNDEPN